ncbi:MAG: hypothetical protein EA357_00255 [Micavibrio sp.]|nr:MAG: hypothetical protein EA357_00255 [Micavibrio sp.]
MILENQRFWRIACRFFCKTPERPFLAGDSFEKSLKNKAAEASACVFSYPAYIKAPPFAKRCSDAVCGLFNAKSGICPALKAILRRSCAPSSACADNPCAADGFIL